MNATGTEGRLDVRDIAELIDAAMEPRASLSGHPQFKPASGHSVQ